jgi:hypothetical protein
VQLGLVQTYNLNCTRAPIKVATLEQLTETREPGHRTAFCSLEGPNMGGRMICTRAWDSYDAIVAACKEAWNFLINDPERIRSIGTRDWACVSI